MRRAPQSCSHLRVLHHPGMCLAALAGCWEDFPGLVDCSSQPAAGAGSRMAPTPASAQLLPAELEQEPRPQWCSRQCRLSRLLQHRGQSLLISMVANGLFHTIRGFCGKNLIHSYHWVKLYCSLLRFPGRELLLVAEGVLANTFNAPIFLWHDRY